VSRVRENRTPGSTGGGWKRSDLATVTGVAQPTGKPAEDRPQALPSGTATAPALDPTILLDIAQAAVAEWIKFLIDHGPLVIQRSEASIASWTEFLTDGTRTIGDNAEPTTP
jgi:hypothetical protein